jgi:hypothetical protein
MIDVPRAPSILVTNCYIIYNKLKKMKNKKIPQCGGVRLVQNRNYLDDNFPRGYKISWNHIRPFRHVFLVLGWVFKQPCHFSKLTVIIGKSR